MARYIYFDEEGNFELSEKSSSASVTLNPKYAYCYGDDNTEKGWHMWSTRIGYMSASWVPRNQLDIPEDIRGIALLMGM